MNWKGGWEDTLESSGLNLVLLFLLNLHSLKKIHLFLQKYSNSSKVALFFVTAVAAFKKNPVEREGEGYQRNLYFVTFEHNNYNEYLDATDFVSLF